MIVVSFFQILETARAVLDGNLANLASEGRTTVDSLLRYLLDINRRNELENIRSLSLLNCL